MNTRAVSAKVSARIRENSRFRGTATGDLVRSRLPPEGGSRFSVPISGSRRAAMRVIFLLQVDHWLDDYAKAGAIVHQVISELASWLRSRSSVNALKVASAVLTKIGRRCDLPILTVTPIEPRDAAEPIIAYTTFTIMIMQRTPH
jgi:hypothetical protein